MRPDVIALQGTLTAEFKFPVYKVSVSSPSVRDTTGSTGRGVCTLVRKGITFIEHKVVSENSQIEPTFIEVISGKKSRKESTFILNVYSSTVTYETEVQGSAAQGKPYRRPEQQAGRVRRL
ncbi:hypothetical protein MRX96_050203 [Rhipicephalus microplus]